MHELGHNNLGNYIDDYPTGTEYDSRHNPQVKHFRKGAYSKKRDIDGDGDNDVWVHSNSDSDAMKKGGWSNNYDSKTWRAIKLYKSF